MADKKPERQRETMKIRKGNHDLKKTEAEKAKSASANGPGEKTPGKEQVTESGNANKS
ncbi:MAG: hypothetical protein OEY29_15665 [Gammaproteobacteria bacterium]|nr:hypothetical protein [Gammaproteobacteria bacterium]